MDIIQITNVDVKPNREMFFTINNKAKYKIPSKMFPLASKKEIGVFTMNNSVDFINDLFAEHLNKIDLPIGRCYSNAEKIYDIMKGIGLDVTYFSGWYFRVDDMPKHHAWVVCRHENGFSIIDSNKENLMRELSKRGNHIDQNNPDWRTQSAILLKSVIKDFPLNSQQIIIGKAVPGTFYVGSPDTIDNARRIYNKLMDEFPKHPSYLREGDNPHGRSKLQEEFAKQGIY